LQAAAVVASRANAVLVWVVAGRCRLVEQVRETGTGAVLRALRQWCVCPVPALHAGMAQVVLWLRWQCGSGADVQVAVEM